MKHISSFYAQPLCSEFPFLFASLLFETANVHYAPGGAVTCDSKGPIHLRMDP